MLGPLKDTDRAQIGFILASFVLFVWLVILLGVAYAIFTAQPAPVYVPGVAL